MVSPREDISASGVVGLEMDCLGVLSLQQLKSFIFQGLLTAQQKKGNHYYILNFEISPHNRSG